MSEMPGRQAERANDQSTNEQDNEKPSRAWAAPA